MNLTDKALVYRVVYENSKTMIFKERNLLLFRTAIALGLRHYFDQDAFTLNHDRKLHPLIVLPIKE